jgi:Tfp pilus assembly PilM family ATPase
MIRRRQRGWIGIDLGCQAVKVAQLERAGDALELTEAVVDVAPEAGGEGAALWPPGPELGQRLRGVLEEGEFVGRQVACVLSMPLTDLRSFKLPPAPRRERRGMIQNELATIFADVDGQRQFDYWEVDDPADSSQIHLDNVAVMSIRQQTLEQVITCVAAARRDCEVLDGMPLALARAVALSGHGNGEAPVGVLDWGYGGATVCVVRRGRPLFTRFLRDCGFGALLNTLADGLGLSRAETQEVLTTYGLPLDESSSVGVAEVREVVLETISRHMRHLVEQLGKTSAYLRVQRPYLVPAKFWLLGGGATIRNLPVFLTGRLNVAFETWNLPVMEGAHPLALFGPAAALSALAWER